MKKFLENKTDIIFLLLLSAALLIMFLLFYGRFGMFFTDTSREVYIPMSMNNGSVLYKDIFNVYQPLAYQINSFLFSLTGGGLKTLYAAGFINSLLFTAGLYLTGCLFLKKEDKGLAAAFCLLTAVSCIYTVSQSNYIFPYSYSIVYALNAVIWSLFFLIKSVQHKADEDKMPADLYICLSALLFGISIFCKYEFILFSAVIAAVLFKENFSLKIKLSAIAAFLCAPAASIAALMLQGCGFDVFKESAGYINALSASPAVHKCYRFLALIPSAASLKFIGLNALKYISCAAAAGFILTKTYRFNKAAALILCAVIIYRLFPVFYQSNAYYFDAAGMLLILEFLLLLPYFIKKRRDKTLNFQDKLFILLLLSVILMSAKGIFSMNLSNYGAYFAPAALLVIWLSGYYYLREIFNINIKTALYFIFALLIVLYLFSNAARRDYAFNSPVKTEKGVIYLPHSQAAAVNGVIKYIKENTNDNDRLLVIPEGAMLNYLTDRRSDDKYYYLIPPNIEIFGADNIARDLENNLPDYIIMPLLTYQNFGETYFCGSFGSKVCALLPKYYEAPVVFGSDFWIALYKKTAAQIPQMPQKSEQLSRQKKENL